MAKNTIPTWIEDKMAKVVEARFAALEKRLCVIVPSEREIQLMALHKSLNTAYLDYKKIYEANERSGTIPQGLIDAYDNYKITLALLNGSKPQ